MKTFLLKRPGLLAAGCLMACSVLAKPGVLGQSPTAQVTAGAEAAQVFLRARDLDQTISSLLTSEELPAWPKVQNLVDLADGVFLRVELIESGFGPSRGNAVLANSTANIERGLLTLLVLTADGASYPLEMVQKDAVQSKQMLKVLIRLQAMHLRFMKPDATDDGLPEVRLRSAVDMLLKTPFEEQAARMAFKSRIDLRKLCISKTVADAEKSAINRFFSQLGLRPPAR